MFLPDSSKNTPPNYLFDKLFDIRRFYVLSPVLIQNLSPPALFSHCPTLLPHLRSDLCSNPSSFLSSFIPQWTLMLSLWLHQKNLGDLSKNTAEVNDLMLAILRAVQHIGAHKATGCKQSVSIFFSWLLLLIFFFLTLFLNLFYFILFYSATMGASDEFLVPTRSGVWKL